MRALLAALSILAIGCGRASLASLPDGDGGSDGGAADAGPDAGPPDGGAPDAGVDGGAALQTFRVALHVHSAISHDACDGHSKDAGPLETRDQDCLRDLKAAICATRLDVALLTDHPAHMDELPFTQDLLFEPSLGEALVLEGSPALPVANRIPCGAGRDALLAVGFEGTHSMPLGLGRPLGDPALYGVHLDDATPLADQQRLIADVRAASGVSFVAHSEETDLSGARLVAAATDGMEWYNVHGNFKQLYGGDRIGAGVDLAHVKDLISALKGLEPFLYGSTGAGAPHADLVYLELLRAGFPEAGLAKWHEVLGARQVVGGLGNDVHQNVSVEPVCKGALAQQACAVVGAAVPNVLTALANGGPVLLDDGERIDSYARVLRWLNNRVLASERSVRAVTAALAAGRSYGVFAVLGEPGVFSLWANDAEGRVELGGSATAASATLHARLPDPPAPELGAVWTPQDAARASLRAVLWRTTGAGRVAVAEWKDFGATVSLSAPGPGRYSLEVWLTPLHLEAALGKASALAGSEYRWILTNAITLH